MKIEEFDIFDDGDFAYVVLWSDSERFYYESPDTGLRHNKKNDEVVWWEHRWFLKEKFKIGNKDVGQG